MKTFLQRILSCLGLYVIKGYKNHFFRKHKIIERNLFGRNALMPRSHTISYNLAHFPYYNTNLQRITREYEIFRKEKFSIIDVGANIGDTLLMLRQVSSLPVHCFEGDPFFYDLLIKNSVDTGETHIHKKLLSDKPGEMKVKNEMSYGTSVLIADETTGQRSVFDSLDHFFSGEYQKETIGIIKTDTDGYDLKILNGAEECLRKHQPVVFMEYDRALFEKNGDDGIAFLTFMRQLNYDGVLVYDNYGKLLCVTTLEQEKTIRSLHTYIKRSQALLPFYDLAFFATGDRAFFESFAEKELAFFEQ